MTDIFAITKTWTHKNLHITHRPWHGCWKASLSWSPTAVLRVFAEFPDCVRWPWRSCRKYAPVYHDLPSSPPSCTPPYPQASYPPAARSQLVAMLHHKTSLSSYVSQAGLSRTPKMFSRNVLYCTCTTEPIVDGVIHSQHVWPSVLYTKTQCPDESHMACQIFLNSSSLCFIK